MIRSSLVTSVFGLTEPLFVPEYWNPPSLFDLAARTGFDLESVVFSFGLGGVGAVLYNALTRRRLESVSPVERTRARHRFHLASILAPLALFPVILLLPWNPIYPAIVAMAIGAVAAVVCRPDLATKAAVGGLLFLGYYSLFLAAMEWTASGYVSRVWNFAAISGIRIWVFPLEELLFAIGFGMYWSAVYEHLTWSVYVPGHTGSA